MRITELLKKESIELGVKVADKMRLLINWSH